MRLLSALARRVLGTHPGSRQRPPEEEQIGAPLLQRCAEFALDVAGACNAMRIDAAGNRGPAIGSESTMHGQRAAIELLPGQALVVPPVVHGVQTTLRLTVACDRGSPSVTVHVSRENHVGGTAVALGSVRIGGGGDAPDECSVDLASTAGAGSTHSYRVTSAAANGARVLIADLLVGPWHRLGRLNALGNYQHRMRRELQHFAGSAYSHAMYGPASSPSTRRVTRGAGQLRASRRDEHAQSIVRRAEELLATIEPASGEAAFTLGMRMLGSVLPMQPPDFLGRADRLGGGAPLRMLSICSGAGRIEEQILRLSSRPIHMTLFDASRDLIERAAGRLAESGSSHRVDCLVGDVNEGLPGDGRFDVILCVSALHHVADLETVLSSINSRLEAEGEFWSIGEQVGRNGNRLWPEALLTANRVFEKLPPRLRRNAHTGEIDARIDDRDLSIGCFEGVRSEELETLLEAHLIPVDVYRRNCFLWRLVDATYSDNFDVGNAEDLAWLRSLVVEEVVHWATGGRSTELHGIYRKKTVR